MKGFTLIELLVSMAIISVLISLISPELYTIRKRTFDLSAKNFIRTVALKLEDHFIENERYFNCENQQCDAYLAPIKVPQGINVKVETNQFGYKITASHQRGTGRRFIFDSERGGFTN